MIPVFKPSVGKEELESLRQVLESGWIGLGPKTGEFEKAFAQYIGVPYAIGTNSCTAALHLALKVLEIKPNDEVISPSLTFISTNHAILYNRAIPVFCDVYEDTLTLDVEDFKKKISKNTKAVIVMHYGGHPCDMDPIVEIAKENGIYVIEDAAHGCGSEYKGRKIGTLGDIACFSFHAVKNLTCGEGGMITTSNFEWNQRLHHLRWLGINKGTWNRSNSDRYSWYYNVEEIGFKCHMSDLNAALGLVQIRKLDKLNERRRDITSIYNQAFSNLEWLKTPVVKNWAKSSHHNYVVKLDKRDEFIEHLKKKEIASSVHYIPNHHYPMYKNFKADVPVTEKVWKKIVTLPLFPDLTSGEMDRVIEAVRAFR